jgi:hypothetical protein
VQVTIKPRLDLLANMSLSFAYWPFLIFLPLLLVVGIIFVVVPGGFIIVLAGAYYASAGVLGLVGLATTSWRRQTRTNRRPAKASSTFPSPIRRSPSSGLSVRAPRPITAARRNDRTVALARARALAPHDES